MGSREKHRLYMREYRKAHPDRRAESKAYLERHGDEIKAKRHTPEYRAKANERKRQRYVRPEVKAKDRAAQIRVHYGITQDEYDRILLSQGGVCALCGKPENHSRVRHLSVEHDHETGRLRGIVCMACNLSLGAVDRGEFSMLYLDVERLSRYVGREIHLSIRPSTPRRRAVVDAWLSGKTPREIAREQGVNKSAVYLMLQKSVQASW